MFFSDSDTEKCAYIYILVLDITNILVLQNVSYATNPGLTQDIA
jgi:hypothetical protein